MDSQKVKSALNSKFPNKFSVGMGHDVSYVFSTKRYEYGDALWHCFQQTTTRNSVGYVLKFDVQIRYYNFSPSGYTIGSATGKLSSSLCSINDTLRTIMNQAFSQFSTSNE